MLIHMKIKVSAFLLICMFLGLTTFGQTLPDTRAEKARQSVAKIGTGTKAKVEVKLRDASTLKGHIGSVDDDSFSLVDEKTSTLRDILFADVDRIKKRGGGLNTGAWIGIAAAAVGSAILIGIISVRCRNEPGTC